MLGEHKEGGYWVMGINILHRRNVQNVGKNMGYWSSKKARCLCGTSKGEREAGGRAEHTGSSGLYQRFLTLARSTARH